MVDAGRGRGVSKARPPDPEIEAVVDAYVKLAAGDMRQALELASADAMIAVRLVSRGFARWGQPKARSRW